LKYDGQRDKNIYTVMVVDLGNPDETKFKDTDELSSTFFELIKMKQISVNHEVQELLLNVFCDMKDNLMQKHDNNLVFVFTIEKKEQLEYYTFIHHESIMKDYSSHNFKELLKFLEIKDFCN
jgi:hypothetical protein